MLELAVEFSLDLRACSLGRRVEKEANPIMARMAASASPSTNESSDMVVPGLSLPDEGWKVVGGGIQWCRAQIEIWM